MGPVPTSTAPNSAMTPLTARAPCRTIAELLLWRAAETPDAEAFWLPPAKSGEPWPRVTWRQFGERVRRLSSGARALGMNVGDRGAILSSTRYEWLLADLAILCAGGASTMIYPSNSADESAHILSDSGARLLFIENADALKKIASLLAAPERVPALQNIVLLDGAKPEGQVVPAPWGERVLTLADFEERGRALDAASPRVYEEIVRAIEPSQLATLCYTSGTTGLPKGVEATHDSWIYESEAVHALGLLGPGDLQYLWLPLSHVFGKVMEVLQLRIGFPTAVDGRVDKLMDNLAVVRPTWSAAVPRIFEKAHSRILTTSSAGGGLKAALFNWAMDVGKRVSRLQQKGQQPGPLLALQHRLADQLVFTKIRARFGGRLRFLVSGSAPLAAEVGELFTAAGVQILEGYGLTESNAASFVNRTDRYRVGTVGPAVPGMEVRIAEEDGEVLLRGRGIMRGYRGLPDATKESIDSEAWLHTGDIGVIEDGFLRITDRKKDLIKTSNGKYVAPQALEGKLKSLSPYISQALVVGNNRSYVSALITIDPDALAGWSKSQGKEVLSDGKWATDADVRALIESAVAQLNKELARHEQIKKFAILEKDFSQEAGEITASLKIKRKIVESHNKKAIDALYASGGGEKAD